MLSEASLRDKVCQKEQHGGDSWFGPLRGTAMVLSVASMIHEPSIAGAMAFWQEIGVLYGKLY